MYKIVYVIMIVILASFVAAGVVFPIPELELRPGETGRFQYVIQTGSPPQKCTMALDGKTPLLVEFDDDEAIIDVPAKSLYGTVKVPENVEFKDYEETFCVTCDPLSEGSGSSVKQSVCQIPIKVKVVRERTKQNIQLPEKPKEKINPINIIGTIVLIILVIVLIVFGLKRPKKVKSKQKQNI